METTTHTRVLLVTDRIAVSPELVTVLRDHASRGAISLRVLVPNPAPAEWHPTHPERHAKAEAAERVLRESLPELREAAGVPVDGTVPTRHDPLDAIEELLQEEQVDELIVATAPHHLEGWLHVDLPHRAAHLGLPVTTVSGVELAPHGRRRPTARRMLNKVPEVTLYFWIIKIMC